jgi:radical SAM enzyme (TIGR04100 family)
MMTILYTINNNLYVNLTNKCPCACTFCLRQEGDGVHGSESLWLEREPTLEEIKAEFDQHDLNSYDQVIFCGYGEPLERLDEVIEVCKYIRTKTDTHIRINTNGLADLIHKKQTAPLLAGLVDAVSISLNAPSAEEYIAIARPSFGKASFASLLGFAADCRKYIGDVTFTVVDMLSKEQLKACKQLAEDMDIKFRVRVVI